MSMGNKIVYIIIICVSIFSAASRLRELCVSILVVLANASMLPNKISGRSQIIYGKCKKCTCFLVCESSISQIPHYYARRKELSKFPDKSYDYKSQGISKT